VGVIVTEESKAAKAAEIAALRAQGIEVVEINEADIPNEVDTAFPQSHAILSRAVSLPVGVKLAEDVPSRARHAIERAMKS
jgi:dTDP-4-amino-4,6-dideoxygalactose transaminase